MPPCGLVARHAAFEQTAQSLIGVCCLMSGNDSACVHFTCTGYASIIAQEIDPAEAAEIYTGSQLSLLHSHVCVAKTYLFSYATPAGHS